MDELLREVLHRAYELPASAVQRAELLGFVSAWIAKTANLKPKTYDEMTNEELVEAAGVWGVGEITPVVAAPTKKRSERAYENAKARKCSVCKEPGHNSRSCGTKRVRFAENEA